MDSKEIDDLVKMIDGKMEDGISRLGVSFSDKKESGRMPGQAAVASSVYGLIAEERTVSCYSARFDNCKLQCLPVISIFCATSPTSFVIPWDDPLSVNETPFVSK